eukprot:CAMPEP_0202858124 /NCGR_PEP_ID=MMETSP1391-20130828/787_1 /ASSEMBLY_ACC=CAM_ASM_000867 /TAXON_ID=1034604 /ORGANISM="Chlamydomonas leiostraca, Strain SAG 11-49" /LENGTH=351 /DNA_ID=CAMNT_0049537009 /DNA_START=179 /DNA_END=1231 /DNA_ORIENTATION=+
MRAGRSLKLPRTVHVMCSSESRPQKQDPVLVQRQETLERLLAREGIELVTDKSVSHSLGFANVEVDWSRYHLQILFIDRTDTLRARVAAGIMDRIAEWNGYGRAMYTWTCGVEASAPDPLTQSLNRALSTMHALPAVHGPVPDEGEGAEAAGQAPPPASPSVATPPSSPASSDTCSDGAGASPAFNTLLDRPAPADMAPSSSGSSGGGVRDARVTAVASHAAALKIPLRSITRAPECFEPPDLDRYDLVVCLDSGIRAEVLARCAPEDREYYAGRVCLLTDFSGYEGDATLLARGGLALLPLQLSFLLRQGLHRARGQVDIPSPQLAGTSGAEEWDAMVRALILSTAGLTK